MGVSGTRTCHIIVCCHLNSNLEQRIVDALSRRIKVGINSIYGSHSIGLGVVELLAHHARLGLLLEFGTRCNSESSQNSSRIV